MADIREILLKMQELNATADQKALEAKITNTDLVATNTNTDLTASISNTELSATNSVKELSGIDPIAPINVVLDGQGRRRGLFKVISDIINTTDIISTNIVKPTLDTSLISDVVTLVAVYQRQILELTTLSELISINLDKIPTPEVLTTSDLLTVNINKFIEESISVTDNLTTLLAPDGLSRLEIISSTDSGSINIQDYFLSDYTEADYVGITINF